MIEIDLFEELDDRGCESIKAFVHPDLHIRYVDGSHVSGFTLGRRKNKKTIALGLLRMRHANIQEKILVLDSGESNVVTQFTKGFIRRSLMIRLKTLARGIERVKRVRV